jgi:hypothetical protein
VLIALPRSPAPAPLVSTVAEAYPRAVRRDPTSEIRRAGERFMTIAATGHRTSHHRQG